MDLDHSESEQIHPASAVGALLAVFAYTLQEQGSLGREFLSSVDENCQTLHDELQARLHPGSQDSHVMMGLSYFHEYLQLLRKSES